MKTLLLLIFMAFGNLAYADIISFNMIGTFTAFQNCSSNCTQIVNVSAAYDTNDLPLALMGQEVHALPGTFQFSTSGLLGTAFAVNDRIASDLTIRFSNGLDEIDINLPNLNFGGTMYAHFCRSQACVDAFSPFGMFRADLQTSVSKVSEPASILFLCIPMIIWSAIRLATRSRLAISKSYATNLADSRSLLKAR